MNRSKIGLKIKEQMLAFSGILSAGLPKTAGRFIAEVVYGIQTRQSVRLTEIGRSLNEETDLHKTQKRLSRQLGRIGLGEKIGENLLCEASQKIHEETLIVIDISDISKKYAQKMEYLAKVHDGSQSTIHNGYWTVNVIGAELDDVCITPLHAHLYSQLDPCFKSENEQILQAIEEITCHIQKKGIYVIDRGGDRNKLIRPLLQEELRFIIRLRGDRHLVYRGKKVLAEQLAGSTKMLYIESFVKEEKGKEKIYRVEYGFRKIKLPGRKEHLYMVVIKGFGNKPMMLLTNVEVTSARKSLLRIVKSYIKRWQIEQTIRFGKQSYTLEDIRLMGYERLKNMVRLVVGVMYFAAVWMGNTLKLRILAHHALSAAKRIFGIPDFRYYALADGMKEILFGFQGRFRATKNVRGPDSQLFLNMN